MELSKEREHLVLDNQKLVYYCVSKMGITMADSDYEDITSIGTIGLIKAAITFDELKGNAFSSYAVQCIKNEIFMYFRKEKKRENDISMEEIIGRDEHENPITIEDKIADPEYDFVGRILLAKEDYIEIANIVLNCFDGKRRAKFLYRMGNATQTEIANRFNTNQGVVSRAEKRMIKSIQKVVDSHVHYERNISMSVIGNEYKISFLVKDVSEFSRIFTVFFQNFTSIEEVPDFKIVHKGRMVTIYIPACLRSFRLIAEMLQEIDECIVYAKAG